jgi:hypothetical protein
MDTFKADSEQGIVDPLGYVSNVPDKIPHSLLHLIGQELYRTPAISS